MTRSSKPLQSFLCSLGVSLSRGFCEQAATGTDFQHSAPVLCQNQLNLLIPLLSTTPFTQRSGFSHGLLMLLIAVGSSQLLNHCQVANLKGVHNKMGSSLNHIACCLSQ